MYAMKKNDRKIYKMRMSRLEQ